MNIQITVLKKRKITIDICQTTQKDFFCAALYALENEWKKRNYLLNQSYCNVCISSRDE